MANVIDFRGARSSMWGHSMHAWTMREITPKGWWQKFKDRRCGAYRMSVMVHHSPAPQVGDLLAWSRKEGGEIVAPITAVKPCGDPRDMFTLEAYVTPDCRKTA
jgi:hypothetical protein